MERRDAVANSRGGIGVKIKDTRGISRNNETNDASLEKNGAEKL